ncbi:hypothetical protein ACPPVO_43075 [Dactylosporangium sp. McL0621]|uniref:hypothetical protein n=1 Tax=Dactylosporangium sp. McL0621 TaxID=3415678 RepID=UPI003CF9BA8A
MTTPNLKLRELRERTPSPWRTGQSMSRAELADAVNTALDHLHPGRDLTAHYVEARWIGKLERGEHHWPSEERRAALRHALGTATDGELGLYISRWTGAPSDGELETEGIDRRTFLHTSLAGAAAHVTAVLTLADLAHVVAAVQDAHRYLDHEIVDHLHRRLDDCIADDGTRGASRTLPTVLGMLGVVEQFGRQVKPAVRAKLLAVGASSAEFAGWLYRDLGQPELANYWRDQAADWSSAVGDETMRGYISLKKSQSAWDDRDARRMLELVTMVQNGPKLLLPMRVRAEALQQEARGHAMISGSTNLVDDKLKQARDLMVEHEQARSSGADGLAEHYDQALLGVQTAMCYREAGQLDQAVELYVRWLSPDVFSRRDYGYFLALKAEALAVTGDPDGAAIDGSVALQVASVTDSVRTLRELRRLASRMEPWSARPAVQVFVGGLRAEIDRRGLC